MAFNNDTERRLDGIALLSDEELEVEQEEWNEYWEEQVMINKHDFIQGVRV